MNVLRTFGCLCLLLATGCHGYYPSWHYAPNREVHALHLDSSAEPRAVVTATLVGILRPEDAVPRRLHARLDVVNRGGAPLTFDGAATRATPSGAAPLLPDDATAVVVAPGEARKVELFFRLPDRPQLEDVALTEIELAWTLALDDRRVTSHATFRRASFWTSGTVDGAWCDPYDPRYFGPYYGPFHDPFCHRFGDPFWHGRRWYRSGLVLHVGGV